MHRTDFPTSCRSSSLEHAEDDEAPLKRAPLAPGERDDDERAARAVEDAQGAELFRVLAYTGLRLGEAVALRWADVDFTGRRLIVRSGSEAR